AKWTHRILDEVFSSLLRDRPDLDPQALDRTRALMLRSVRDCLVCGYEPLMDALELPDPDDRHVLAAAIKARAQMIVTASPRASPAERLTHWDIEAKHPDHFVLDQIDLDRQAVYGAVQRIADSQRKPPRTVRDVLGSLERAGLVEAVAALRS